MTIYVSGGVEEHRRVRAGTRMAMLSLRRFSRARCAALALAVNGTAVACVPRLKPLMGAPAPAHLPVTELPPGHRHIVFDWELHDGDVVARGEGVARVASPDSARLDLFVRGGFGGGAAVLVGDSIRIPGSDLVRRFVPSPALLWATLGRVAVPPYADTVARVDGRVLRVDIGKAPSWRITFDRDTLVRLERVNRGHIAEWVERSGEVIHYRNEETRRSLTLTVKRKEEVAPFDASIWAVGAT